MYSTTFLSYKVNVLYKGKANIRWMAFWWRNYVTCNKWSH